MHDCVQKGRIMGGRGAGSHVYIAQQLTAAVWVRLEFGACNRDAAAGHTKMAQSRHGATARLSLGMRGRGGRLLDSVQPVVKHQPTSKCKETKTGRHKLGTEGCRVNRQMDYPWTALNKS